MEIDDKIRLWRSLAAMPSALRLEDQFELAIARNNLDPEEHDLNALRNELENAKRLDELIDLCRAVLASGAEFPTNWSPTLADALVAAGRLDEAEPVVRDVVGQIESYKSEMVIAALHYHRARGERDVEAMLHFAGKRWFTSYSLPKKEAKHYDKPDHLAQKFLAWLERWLHGSYWNVATCAELGHWLVWFDEIGKEHCAERIAAFEAERDRRRALFERLRKARRESMPELAAEIVKFPGDPDFLAPLAEYIRERNPEVAYQLLAHAVASERRTGYRYHSGQRVDVVNILMGIALTKLPDRLAEAYAIGESYVRISNPAVHYNLACCAARLGKKRVAIIHASEALRHGWDKPDELYTDGDLASLRGEPGFEQLFGKKVKKPLPSQASH